jgi:hypothetical protein
VALQGCRPDSSSRSETTSRSDIASTDLWHLTYGTCWQHLCTKCCSSIRLSCWCDWLSGGSSKCESLWCFHLHQNQLSTQLSTSQRAVPLTLPLFRLSTAKALACD